MAPSDPVRIVDAEGNPITADNPLPIGGGTTGTSGVTVSENWRVAYRYDEAENDSDKQVTVPANEEWQVQWVHVELTTTATAGARQLELQILDSSDDLIGKFVAGVTQAASLTYIYEFGPGCADQSAVRDATHVTVATPLIFLAEGWSLRIFDNNVVAAAADDMIVQIPIAIRSV